MTPASKSIYYFGFYLLILGISLTVFPNELLSLFQFPKTGEVWVHVIGAIVFNLGLYYVFMASTNNPLFLILTMYTRAAVFIWFVVFVVVGWAPVQLIMFGVVDLAGAAWTYVSMRK